MFNRRAAARHLTSPLRPRRGARRLFAGAALALLTPFGLLSVNIAAQLPVPCATGACGATGPQTWVTSGRASLVQAGNMMTITQNSENATLNWQSFNIGNNGSV